MIPDYSRFSCVILLHHEAIDAIAYAMSGMLAPAFNFCFSKIGATDVKYMYVYVVTIFTISLVTLEDGLRFQLIPATRYIVPALRAWKEIPGSPI